MSMLKSFDFLGIQPQFYISSQDMYKTKIGATISIVAFFLIMALSCYFTLMVLNREQLSLVSSTTDQFDKTLDLNKIPIVVKGLKTTGDPIELNSVYPILQFWDLKPEFQGKPNITNIPFHICQAEDFEGYEDMFKDFVGSKSAYCLNRTGFNLTIYGANGDIVNGYSKMNFYLARCTNGTISNPNADKNSCRTKEDIDSILQSISIRLYFSFPDNIINFNNFTNPFSSYLRTEEFTLTLGANYKYMYYIKKVIVHSDFGFVFEDTQQVSSFQYERTDAVVFLNSGFTVKEAFGLLSSSLVRLINI
jgi:hypothetical protein